jgi:flagellar biosynthetic protein FliP
LFLTLFIMSPVLQQVNDQALQPYLQEQVSAIDAIKVAAEPFKTFMLAQTRETDIRMFADIAGVESIDSPEATPLRLLLPAFVTSELKTAFQIGFMVFIPFVIIDLVVASVLMSMGMMMLSPLIVSLPFKLMLFVLVDGWSLIMGTLASSFLVNT